MKTFIWMLSLSMLLWGSLAYGQEVECESETGYCIVGDGWSKCSCLSGMGGGSASAVDNDSANGDVAAEPAPTDEELKARCEEELSMMCGDKVPVPAEECEAESLETCTSFLSINAAFEMACAVTGVNSTSADTVDIGDAPEVSGGGADAPPPADDDGGVAEDPDDDDLRIAPPEEDPDAIAYEPTAWDIVDCCEEMAAPDEEEFVECVLALEEGDCEGFEECGGLIEYPTREDNGGDGAWETIGLDDGEADLTSDDGVEKGASGGDSEEAEAPGDGDESAADAEEADDDGSDSGCSAVPVNNGAAPSLITLVFSLF